MLLIDNAGQCVTHHNWIPHPIERFNVSAAFSTKQSSLIDVSFSYPKQTTNFHQFLLTNLLCFTWGDDYYFVTLIGVQFYIFETI